MSCRQPFLLFYDEECSVCRASMRAVLRLAPPSLVEPVGLRSEIADRMIPGETMEERLQAFHLVAPDGRHWKGPDAIPPLFDRLRRLRPAGTLLRRSPPAFRITARTYEWVARHRGQLARFIPTSWARPLEPPPSERRV